MIETWIAKEATVYSIVFLVTVALVAAAEEVLPRRELRARGKAS